MFEKGRRKFIGLIGSAAVWPLAARAQQPERMRRIGVLMHLAADDPEGQTRHAAFLQGLQQAGWSAGRNVRIDTRWAASEADRRWSSTRESLRNSLLISKGLATLHLARAPRGGARQPEVHPAFGLQTLAALTQHK
jgi:putative ABC transport system substrate-binding protein